MCMCCSAFDVPWTMWGYYVECSCIWLCCTKLYVFCLRLFKLGFLQVEVVKVKTFWSWRVNCWILISNNSKTYPLSVYFRMTMPRKLLYIHLLFGKFLSCSTVAKDRNIFFPCVRGYLMYMWHFKIIVAGTFSGISCWQNASGRNTSSPWSA